MRPVTVEKVLACGARLGITQVAGPAGSPAMGRTVNRVFPLSGGADHRTPEAAPPHAIWIFPPGAAKSDFLNERGRRLSHPRSRNIPCIAVSGREIPDDLLRYSESTGTPVFASRYDHFLIRSRLIGLLREMGERTIMVHGVLLRVSGRGVLLTGESGIGKTASGLSLMHSGNRWVADDAVVLEESGDALYGRGHERTRDWIAVRGRGILRAEELLGRERLLGRTRVDATIHLVRASGRDEDLSGDPFREFVGVSIPRRDLAADADPGRTADRLIDCVCSLATVRRRPGAKAGEYPRMRAAAKAGVRSGRGGTG